MSRRVRLVTKEQRRKRIVTYVTVEREVVSLGPVYTAFAETLKVLRKKAGLRQEDLAKAMGMSRPSLANIEAGRQRVLLDDVFSFAEALSIEPKKLFAMVAAEIQ